MNKYEKKSFSRDDVNNVVISLLAFNDEEMGPAYDLWAGEDGRIDASEFMEASNSSPSSSLQCRMM